MRGKLMLGVVALAVVGACGGQQGEQPQFVGRQVAAKVDDTVKVTASCQGNNGIDVVVDKWAVDLTPNGRLNFLYDTLKNGSEKPTVVIAAPSPGKGGAQWRFRGFPFSLEKGVVVAAGQSNGSNNAKPSHYMIKISCGSGATARTVNIDPDIFVD